MKSYQIFLYLAILVFLAACGTPEGRQAQTTPAMATSIQDPTKTLNTPTGTATATHVPITDIPGTVQTTTPTVAPQAWQSMPIIPVISDRMIKTFHTGLAAGRDPTHFSKIGDCQNIATFFLASLDNPKYYRLGSQYASLQPTIDHFAGSWSRQSLAVKGGLNVAAALNPLWADPKQCEAGETPVACEIRVFNPSIAIVSMEESWSGDIVAYDLYLRKIVEYLLTQSVVPILATRAELPESSIDINATVARIAYDYQVPLWNLWAATNPLPSHGLTVDGFHLTQAGDFFDDAASMQAGWPWRNLTALQSIDAVFRAVSAHP
jgi:hypothetical protein